MSTAEFAAELSRSGPETIVRLSGELEDESAAHVRQVFEQALSERPARLLIDLSELEFMGSTGIWLMVEAHRRCVEAGIRLRLEGKPLPAVAQALALSGVGELASSETEFAQGDGGDRAEIQLRLYVSSRSSTGTPALNTVRAVIDRLSEDEVQLEVIDVFEDPGRAMQDRVIATPTLIKATPAPELRLIGSLGDPEAVLRHLGLAPTVA